MRGSGTAQIAIGVVASFASFTVIVASVNVICRISSRSIGPRRPDLADRALGGRAVEQQLARADGPYAGRLQRGKGAVLHVLGKRDVESGTGEHRHAIGQRHVTLQIRRMRAGSWHLQVRPWRRPLRSTGERAMAEPRRPSAR